MIDSREPDRTFMGKSSSTPRLLRFGAFELDLRSGELRKKDKDGDKKVPLQDQPFQLLSLLAQSAGEVVSREELRARLWPDDTFVDFEDGLNKAIQKIRTALGDSARNPQYVETLTLRGYRFICPVEPVWGNGSGPPAPDRARILSLAVLPLQNLTGDPAQEYFAEGMTEELTNTFAQIRALRVIARYSSAMYKDRQKRMPEIARELGVEGVVDGSVRRSHDFVRITAQLVHGPSGRNLWTGGYTRELRDALALQMEVAMAIATEVQIRLSEHEKERLSSPREVKPEALEAYLLGRHFWNRRTEEALNTAIGYFKQAIQADPDYAAAHAGLADCYTMLAWNSMRAPKDALPKAKVAAETALRIDGELAEAHSSLAANLMFYDWDWAGAEREFKRSIDLNPSYGVVRPWYAFELAALGRHVEASAESQNAIRIDPLALPILVSSGLVFYLSRSYDRAIEVCQKILKIDSTSFYQVHFVIGLAYEGKGMHTEAINALNEAVKLSKGNPHMLAAQGYVLASSGKSAEAVEIIHELKDRLTRGYISPHNIAMVYAGLRQTDETLEWLERAYEDRSMWLIFVNAYPIFDFLRQNHRFQRLVDRMGFPPELRA